MLIFYFMLFTSSTLEIFTELHYSIAEGVILQCILHNCRHSSSTFEQAMYYLLVPPSTSYSPSCTATGAGLLHRLVIGVMVSQQSPSKWPNK
jgi:hypothetical protein